ncbi:MAG: hypothetical protein RL318_2313 [Fibrobacterota bacterium]
MRLVAGLFALGAALVLGAMIWSQQEDAWWRLMVFPPLFMGFLGIFQSRSGICAAYSLMGLWECPTGTAQKIPDPRIENQFKELAKRLLIASFLISSLLVGIFIAL